MKMSENQLLMVQKKQVVIQKGKKVACNENVDFYVLKMLWHFSKVFCWVIVTNINFLFL